MLTWEREERSENLLREKRGDVETERQKNRRENGK